VGTQWEWSANALRLGAYMSMNMKLILFMSMTLDLTLKRGLKRFRKRVVGKNL
jgi:hypothetical protein